MGLMGDGYRGTYQGHTIELIRDNLAKKLKLVIDGVEFASQPRAMQYDITLTATLVHEGHLAPGSRPLDRWPDDIWHGHDRRRAAHDCEDVIRATM